MLGIEPVPDAERNGDPLELFWVWFAANISILGLPLGASLVAFQLLNIWQALLVAAVGAAGAFALVGVVSVAGRRGGAPSMTLSRATFGSRGNVGPTLVSLLSRLGWEMVSTTTGAFVLLSLFAITFGTASDAKGVPVLAIIAILVFETCTLLVSGLGHAAILVIRKWASWIFGALNVFVAIFLVATVDWSAVASAPAGPFSAVMIGIGVIAAGTGIGWANVGADMARYQRRGVRARHLIASSAAGAGIPLVVLIGLGAPLTAGDPTLASGSDPVAAIRELLPTWMAAVSADRHPRRPGDGPRACPHGCVQCERARGAPRFGPNRARRGRDLVSRPDPARRPRRRAGRPERVLARLRLRGRGTRAGARVTRPPRSRSPVRARRPDRRPRR